MSSTPRTIAQAIEDAAKADPTRGYRFFGDSGIPGYLPPGAEGSSEATFSYTAVERTSARFGGALQALGLRKGDRVALILPNNDDFVLCFLGAIRAGIVPVPIYPPIGLGQLQAYLDNTRHIVAKSGARALVTTSKIKRLLGTVQSECPDLEQVVAIEGIRESIEPLKPEKITLDDVAFLQFTSGSTSRPKGVTLTHANLAANIACIMRARPAAHRRGRRGVVAAALPRHGAHRLRARAAVSPCARALPAAAPLPEAPGHLAPGLHARRAAPSRTRRTSPTPCASSASRPRTSRGSISRTWRVAGCGAEPIRPETLEAFAETFSRIGFKKEAFLPSYGMAESSLAISFTELGQGMKTIAVNGPTLWENGQAKIVPEDDDDRRAPRLVRPAVPRARGARLRPRGHDERDPARRRRRWARFASAAPA